MKRLAVRIVSVFGLAAFVLLSFGCLMYTAGEFIRGREGAGDAPPMMTSAAQVILAWDPHAGVVQSYRVYFRLHGNEDWVYLGDVSPDPDPQYTVEHSMLGNGEYDFGVTAVIDGAESSLHSSLDPTASPTTGWYLKWKR